MTDTERELAHKIIKVLDDGSLRVEPGVRDKLAAARQAALARCHEERAPAWVLAGANGGEARYGLRQASRLLLVAAALLCAVALGLTWHAQSQTDIAEIDAGLLSDELPINAYLDRGFDSWLKRVSR
jgi:uncharacterized protein DUF3619